MLRNIGVKDDQEIEYYCGFKAGIISLSLKRYSPSSCCSVDDDTPSGYNETSINFLFNNDKKFSYFFWTWKIR